MKVFVAGHRGMLGHVVVRHLSQNGCEVVTSETRYEGSPHDPLVDEIRSSECAWVVNALGKIKQKCEQTDALIKANTLFPLQLRKRLHADQRLIHASTDCVFSGRAGNYSVDSNPDADDEYGLSKLLGECVAEPGRAYVLRSSIIGPELVGHVGLMSWFLQQRGTVDGFVNHLWNGLTTLEWSKVCLEIMRGQPRGQGPLWHLGVWPPISKYELLQMIGRTWKHNVPIRTFSTADRVDRSLIPTSLRRALSEQLIELKQWY